MDEDRIQQTYTKELSINQGDVSEGDSDLHDYILRGLAELDESELEYVFGVRDPSRLLSEGEVIHGNVVVEDFAITGSYNGGEMALGQVVSCNGKEKLASIPRDYIQINNFGEDIKQNPEIDPEITGHYIVRTAYEPEEVRRRNRYFQRDLGFFGSGQVKVDIHRIEPEEKDIGESVSSFYRSLTD